MKKRWWLFLLFLSSALLSACGSRLGANSWPGVSAADGRVYVAAGPAVYALTEDNGRFLWAFTGQDEKGFSAYAAPALSPDHTLLVVGDYGGVLYGLTPEGDVRWRFAAAESHYVASPLVTDQAVYAPNADGTLYALDLNGQQQWVFHAGQPLWGAPVTDGQRLYLPSLGHHLYALDPRNGAVLWDVDLGGALAGQPTLQDGVLYVGTFAKEIVALDAASGKILWKTPATGWVWDGPTYDPTTDTLYVGDLGGKFFALDAKTGQQRWAEQPDGAIVGRPTLADGVLYFPTEDGALIALSVDDKPRWQYAVQGHLYASPLLTKDHLLLAPYKGENLVIALDLDGRMQWALPVKQAEAALKASKK